MYRNNVYEDLEVRDGAYGVVTGGSGRGLFLTMENGQGAFARFGSLCPGTKVLCTVLKKASESRRMFVSIDSVLEIVPLAA